MNDRYLNPKPNWQIYIMIRCITTTGAFVPTSIIVMLSLLVTHLHVTGGFLTPCHHSSTRMKQLELHGNIVSKSMKYVNTKNSGNEQQLHHISFELPVLAAARGRPKSDDNNESKNSNNNKWSKKSHLHDEASPSLSLSSTKEPHEEKPSNLTIPEITLFRKEKQKRRKLKQPRRPSSFWADLNNIETELRLFWSSLNVPIPIDEPPPIPNEALLNHFERHDLRYAIANKGGRDVVSIRLDGAKLIPGKWTQAVATCKEVQFLLHPKNPAGRGLSEDVPPMAPYVKRSLRKRQMAMKKKQMETRKLNLKRQKESIEKRIDFDGYIDHNINDTDVTNVSMSNVDALHDDEHEHDDDIDPIEKLRYMGGQRWAHSSGRNPRGHWSQDVIIQELYKYLSHVKEEKGRPSVWMPRPSELATEGRDDLKQAMVRFGGSAKTCDLAKLIPYREWRHFESTLELFVELLKYLVKYHDGSEKVFPKLADIQGNGHERLYDLIMEYGGKKIVATKLDMEFQAQTKLDLFKGMSFGPFSLDFAVRLMYFIRNDLMKKDPPLERAKIQMPTKQYLLDNGEVRLAEEVSKYGGHESIARRLHLAFDQEEVQREAKAFRTLKP
mmetsp:Transcript_16099/g.24157  ORF Transcript_16099/g.24157 Transcript_16099/m.24157 type:complete len:610 (-) Transcript_16099:2030-3859(-)